MAPPPRSNEGRSSLGIGLARKNFCTKKQRAPVGTRFDQLPSLPDRLRVLPHPRKRVASTSRRRCPLAGDGCCPQRRDREDKLRPHGLLLCRTRQLYHRFV